MVASTICNNKNSYSCEIIFSTAYVAVIMLIKDSVEKMYQSLVLGQY